MINLKPFPKISRWLIVSLCTGLLVVGLGLGPLGLSPAQADVPFYWNAIDVDIALQADGDMLVTETQTYRFTADHTSQRYRYIPLDRLHRITDAQVYQNDQPIPTQTGTQNNQYWIRWQQDLNAPESHTFVLKYRVVGGVLNRRDYSQIYWRALFPERDAPINRGKVTVQVPEALVGNISQFESRGVPSSDRQIAPDTFEFSVDRPLAPKQFLDVRLQFPSGLLDLSASQTASGLSRLADYLWVGAMLLGGGVIIFSLIDWVTQRRCPRCGQFSLRRTRRQVPHPTKKYGKQLEITQTCRQCGYRHSDRKTIIYSGYSGSSSWGGYGGYGGGGGCGGGGGGCGGGGGG